MKQYAFRALIMLEPACGTAARGQLGATHARCLLQPCHGTYFPALISAEEELPARAAMHAVITTPLADGEAEAFFGPGQRFTIWADAVVGNMVQAHGLVGQGIITYPLSSPLPGAHDDRVEEKAADPARRHSLAAPGAPAAPGPARSAPGCMNNPERAQIRHDAVHGRLIARPPVSRNRV